MVPEVDVHTLAAARADGAHVIDVREPHEYAGGHVPGAHNIPLSLLPLRVHELPAGRRVYVICELGGRSYEAAAYLARSGVQAHSVAGGTSAWVRAGHPVINGPHANTA